MSAIYITIASLVILLGFEIRHRLMTDTVDGLRAELGRLDREILKLKDEMKLKKNIYEEYKPPSV